jgi:hypothetical protein
VMGLEISGIVDYIGCLIGLQPIYIQHNASIVNLIRG